MKVTFILRRKNGKEKDVQLLEGSTLMDLVDKVGLSIDVTVGYRNDLIIPCDFILKEYDRIVLNDISSSG